MKAKINMPVKEVWKIIEDVEHYPEHVKYMHKAKLSGPFGVGSQWVDVTTVLWIPMAVTHKVAKLKENKEIVFDISLPFGGRMIQTVILNGDQKTPEVVGEIDFDLGNPLANFLVGQILKRRLQDMLASTLKKVQGGSGEG